MSSRPNLRTAELISLTGWPAMDYCTKPRVNTERAHDRNTFQITENFQKTFGFEISKAKRAPPTGAPKAALTPAEHPAAIMLRL